MIILISLLNYPIFSLPNNHDNTFNDNQFKLFQLDDSSDISITSNPTLEASPSKKKFPFVPVLVSAAFVILIAIIALVYLIKKLRARKNYKDLNVQEIETQLIPNENQKDSVKPLENPIEPVGIDSQKEEEKNDDAIDPEKKDEKQKNENHKREEHFEDKIEDQKDDKVENT